MHESANKYTQDILLSWDRQIKLFGMYFLSHVLLPDKRFTLLDVGCGTGSALQKIKQTYPNGVLYGCDLDPAHLNLARTMNGSCAEYYLSDIDSIQKNYDVIYISNVLEHIDDWQPKVLHLLCKCKNLFILVPYKEEIGPLDPELPKIDQHVSSFDKNSFLFLIQEGFKVNQRVIRTPYAWGHPLRRDVIFKLRSFILRVPYESRRELLIYISHPSSYSLSSFRNILTAWLLHLLVRS